MCTPMYTTSTFITEAPCPVTYVQQSGRNGLYNDSLLLLGQFYDSLRPHLLKIPTIAAIYEKVVELVQPIIRGSYYATSYLQPRGSTQTHIRAHIYTHIHTHTNAYQCSAQNQFNKQPGACLVKSIFLIKFPSSLAAFPRVKDPQFT